MDRRDIIRCIVAVARIDDARFELIEDASMTKEMEANKKETEGVLSFFRLIIYLFIYYDL